MSIPKFKDMDRAYGFDEVAIVPGDVTVNPDQESTFNLVIHAPSKVSVGTAGTLNIKAVSQGNPSFVQTKKVTVKGARPGPKWSIELSPDKLKKSVKAKGSSMFILMVSNNGNRRLGDVDLSIKHKYHPLQFKTKVSPKILSLGRPGATGSASAIIEPKFTGPGSYKFDLIARWQERILNAEAKETITLEYSTQAFLRSKYFFILIGVAAGFITALILVLRFVI